MSGVVGLFDRGRGSVECDDLMGMMECIDHRGPDGSSSWIDDHVALGYQQLQSTPESRYEDQPFRSEGLVVVSDARLDNRGELFEKLGINRSSEQVTDNQLLQKAYEKWGNECVNHLVGAYSFGVWDQDSNSVFCARDHFGVKPLYYCFSGNMFAFASEIKALLDLPWVHRRLDERLVGDYLLGTFEDKENSFYRSINRLPPAHAMTVQSGDADRWRYWSLDPWKSLDLESDAAYERRFHNLFKDAVGCRLRTNEEVAAGLSGGLDSSSISVMAQHLMGAEKTLHTYSNVDRNAPSSDEREFIETIVNRYEVDPHYVFLDGIGALVDSDIVMDRFDRPPHDTMQYALWQKAKCAKENDTGVFLEGVLGDSAVGYGLGLFPQLLRTGHWIHLYRELTAMSKILDVSRRHLFRRHVLSPIIPGKFRYVFRKSRGLPVSLERENPTIDPDFIERIDLDTRYKELTSYDNVMRNNARLRQYRSLLAGMITTSLETSDITFATFGIEPRYPFTDKRLVEFSLATPPTQQLRKGWTRSIIRRSLDDLLPEKIQWRPWKTPMNEAFWNALSLEEDKIKDVINNPGKSGDYLDTFKLQEALDRFTENPSSRDARVLWRALSLSEWLRANTV